MNHTLTDFLNKQIANWSILYVKLHNFHWFVKGQQFFTLHLKFEELYNEASLHIDEIAERQLSIGGNPVATMKQYLELSSIREAIGNEKAENMVQSIIDDYSTIILELKEGMDIAQKENDETTSDMLLAIHTELEKHVWMLKSFLGK